MITVGLVPNREKPSANLVVNKVKDFLERHRIKLKEFSCRFDELPAGCSLADELAGWQDQIDLIMVVGGDGTILRVARIFVMADTDPGYKFRPAGLPGGDRG